MRKRVREVEKRRHLSRRIVALTLLFALLGPLCRTEATAAGSGPERPLRGSSGLTVQEETAADWQASVDRCMRTGEWRRDLIEVAKTQLGYCESSTDTREINGVNCSYTRYGDFMDSAESVVYGPWCASFVSFCLYYAGVAMPLSSGCSAMIRKLVDVGYYRPAGEYDPRPGDLIFFYSGLERDAEKLNSGHMGIIVEIRNGVITTIEGGRQIVMYFQHDMAKEGNRILGYAEIPDNPNYRTVTDEEGLVSVSGILPEGVTVRTSRLTRAQVAPLMQEEVLCCAYEVALMLDGKKYEPKRPVSVYLHQEGLDAEGARVIQMIGYEEGREPKLCPLYYIRADEQGVSFVTCFMSGFAAMRPAPPLPDETEGQENSAAAEADKGASLFFGRT